MEMSTMNENDKPEGGWAFPNSGSRAKAHYFPKPDPLEPSLCGRWGYTGHPLQGGANSKPSTDDCGACRKKLEAAK